MNRIAAMALRIIRQFLRDKRTLALVFIVPIVVFTLFGILFKTESANIRVGVINSDKGAERTIVEPPRTFPPIPVIKKVKINVGQKFVEGLKENGGFDIIELAGGDTEKVIRENRLDGLLLFAEDFSGNIIDGKGIRFGLVIEGTSYSKKVVLENQFEKFFSKTIPGLLIQGTPLETNLKVEIDTRYVYGGKKFTNIDYFSPVFIAFFVFFLTFLLTIISFLRERAYGTMERLFASPLTKMELILGYSLGFSIFALAQSALVLFFTLYVLKINYMGSIYLLFALNAIFAVGAVNMGILLSFFAKNELQAVQFIPIVIVPQVFLSGLIWPIRDLPGYLKPLSYIMPLTYASSAIEGVMIKGFGLGQIGFEFVMLILFAFLMMLLGSLVLKRRVA
ncbi:hypothetical protein COY52_11600 [Candidatus Desantisbacteria bacterium CG_4_10_14_0_8_um_filter_48_22]|uniref:ABC transmembrane type-2 domain-containing protein n=1 Tax=Candidatus Desantisbacteria bacterium CG_4_10_14_0_8_um_filter_48_22 TaxID=1974543 RepID=A0A2M7S516_9BACT|nr:MAG: hypothetical protein AUJ67_00790 [Candidatus Desantisbacteria bacterium CG1_02_49_89]PIV55271.1 MAG: hypothetical protein COS16_07655 [Candidatus Desantisbacteria bacterium CG02_land_8_20_14_3_00_49_13]PIZ14642.1 MAG: hypothetical protein COY52_11600 [Candidatus Desantisbacteria bacterium CG_4_10_14_0_8_um_filter_48_22]